MFKSCLVQQCLSSDTLSGEWYAWQSDYYEMLRLTFPRHSAYARAHQMDYWCILGDWEPTYRKGAWSKVHLLLEALTRGYDYIAWIDPDAAIVDMHRDLRDALPADKSLGACWHDPANSAYLRKHQVPPHYNVGAMYLRNTPETVQFFKDWLAAYPATGRWMEQGVFNELATGDKYAPVFHRCSDDYNATINVNDSPTAVVRGWHGIIPPVQRLNLMRAALSEDFIKFKV